MKLKEFETYSLLQSSGISLPAHIVITSPHEIPSDIPWPRTVIKAQTLMKKRGKRGLVKVVSSISELRKTVSDFFSDNHEEPITEVLLQEYIEHTHEYYIGFSFDTSQRAPVFIFSVAGGV